MVKDDKKSVNEKVKKVLLSSFVTLGCVGLFHSVKNACAASVTMPIFVKLISAIEMTVGASLTFGTLAMTTQQGGMATLFPSTNKFITDNSGSLVLAGGVPQVGRIKVRGAAFPVTISLEDNTVQLTNGLAFVTVKNFNILTDNAGRSVDYTPDIAQNSFTVPIGGTLVTKPQQAAGTYVGRTRVFVNFQ